MSGRVGAADTSRGPLMGESVKDDPRLEVQIMRGLREQGLSYQSIADRVGTSYRRVYVALNRDRVSRWNSESEKRNRAYYTAQNLARRRARAGKCELCGSPLSGPSHASPCRPCRLQMYAEKLDALAEMWKEGLSSREIAVALEVPRQSVGAMASEARRRGYDLERRSPQFGRAKAGA